MSSMLARQAEDSVDREGGERRGKPERLVSSSGGDPEVCESLRGSVRVTESLTLVLALQELSPSMELIEEHKAPEDLSEASGATEKDGELRLALPPRGPTGLTHMSTDTWQKICVLTHSQSSGGSATTVPAQPHH